MWDVGWCQVDVLGQVGRGVVKSQGKKGQTNELSYDDAWRFPYKILSATKETGALKLVSIPTFDFGSRLHHPKKVTFAELPGK